MKFSKPTRVCIFGLQGSGKSVYLKYICRENPKHLVYDIMHEHNGLNQYLPENKMFYDDATLAELDNVIKKLIIDKPNKIKLLAIDECNRLCPNRRPLPSTIGYLNDEHRHMGLSLVFVARRPSQMNTDLVELAHILIIYRLTGKNDCDYLNNIVDGLGDKAKELDDYHYLYVDEHRHVKECEPVEMD